MSTTKIKPRPCPICGTMAEWEGNPWRPFCSQRCKIRDLGAWASGEYAVPGTPATDDETVKTADHDPADDENIH